MKERHGCRHSILRLRTKFHHGDGAGGNLDFQSLQSILRLQIEWLICDPIVRALNLLGSKVDRGIYVSISIDVGQPLLRFEYAFVIEKSNYPTAFRSID